MAVTAISSAVLITASNLHSGGAVQVAASFIDELTLIASDQHQRVTMPWLADTDVELSTEVSGSLTRAPSRHFHTRTIDRTPRSVSNYLSRSSGYQVSFQLFGPDYGLSRARRQIMGYADVRSVYPSPRGETLTYRQRVRWATRALASRSALRRADRVIVETQAVKARLQYLGLVHGDSISVVENTYNSVFDRPRAWRSPAFSRDEFDCDILLLYITRAYPHKNLAILDSISESAWKRYGIAIRFLVTLTIDEWNSMSAGFHRVCFNLGPVSLQEVPLLYELADAAIFTSLLEAYSAMPIEAMKMRRLVFASDRDFVRSSCKSAAVYVDPLDPSSIADTIIRVMSDEESAADYIARSDQIVSELPSAADRARAYLRIIDHELSLAAH